MESLHGLAPFRLPLWDRASAEFCFARSRDLLTRIPLKFDSSVECLESSEADETLSLPLCNTQKEICQQSENEMSDINWKLKQIVRSSSYITANQPVNVYTNGELKLSVSPDSESTLSQHSDDVKTASHSYNSSYSNITYGNEKNEDKISETKNDNSLLELQSLSEIIQKYPTPVEDGTGYSISTFKTDIFSPKNSEGSSTKLSQYIGKYKREKVVKYNVKKLEKCVDHIPCGVDEKDQYMFNNNYGHTTEGQTSFSRRQDIGKKLKNSKDAGYDKHSSKEKTVLPPTPVFKRKLTQFKTGEKLENKTIRSSPNSPGISFPKTKFRPRTNSLTEGRMYSSLMLNKRQSLNFEKHCDSSSSESDCDISRVKRSLKFMNNYNNMQYGQTSSSSSCSEELVSYQTKTKF